PPSSDVNRLTPRAALIFISYRSTGDHSSGRALTSAQDICAQDNLTIVQRHSEGRMRSHRIIRSVFRVALCLYAADNARAQSLAWVKQAGVRASTMPSQSPSTALATVT